MSRLSSRRGHPLLPYLLIFPTLLFVLIFTVYPTISSVVGSLFQHRLNIPRYRQPVFYGVGNYVDLFTDPEFHLILGNTIRYVVTLVPMWVVTALFLALCYVDLALHACAWHCFIPPCCPWSPPQRCGCSSLPRSTGCSTSSSASSAMPDRRTGPVIRTWLLWSLILVAFWKDAGFYMIFYLAGVQNLPSDVYEALKLEGAGPLVTFFRFTLPLLRRTTLFVTTVAVIGAFRMVDHVFILTQGGPSSRSTLLLYHLWQVRFDSLNVGRSSAITVVLVVLLLTFTITNFIVSERRTADA